MTSQTDRALAFHSLHQGPAPLVLPNAWDAASARLVQSLGARAIATSSAAVAWAHGYADGHHVPVEALLSTVREIVRVAPVPVTTDIEGGYDDDAGEVAQTVTRVIEAGAVGINIEDGVGAPEALCRKIEAARKAAEQAGVKLFINARADVYLRNLAQGEAALAETIRRGGLYRGAGADGVFVPFVKDPEAIRTIVAAVPLPVNVIVMKGLPSVPELAALGVRRVSAGTSTARAAFEALRTSVEKFLADGDCNALAAAGGSLPDMNSLFRDIK